jgi:hypothetical protein
MTNPTTKTIFERQEKIDYEWKDGDDDEIWFEGYGQGYHDGIVKVIGIINEVRNTPDVDRVPFHLTMSAVVATLREIVKGNGNGVS